MDAQPSSRGLTIGLSLLFAFAAASVHENVYAFVEGGVLGALIAQILHLRKLTGALTDELRNQRLLRDWGAGSRVSPATPDETASTRAAPPPLDPGAAPANQPRPFHGPPPGPQPAVAPEPSVFDRAAAAAWAWFKRGNPLARSGLVILFFGAAFLAKYAAERRLLPIELRFAALAIGAFALLFLGWRLRESRAAYARLLQGGGVAGLYLTVFAAAQLHQLLPLGLAFILLALIALATAVLATAQNALPLAVIATAGGFLAPILTSSGSGDHVALFSYYAILNLGVFAVAWFRTWRALNVLGLFFTFTITGVWRATGYERADLPSAEFFLILFFLMYVGVSVLNCVRRPPDLKGYVSGSLVFGLPVAAFTLHATLVAHIKYALAWSALALGAFYLALGWALLRTRRESFRLLVEAFAALGVIFASLAIPLAFDTRTTAAMWAVEGAGLIWLGVRQQRKLARIFGALLQTLGALGFLAGLSAGRSDVAVLNTGCLGAVMLGVSGVFSGYWLFRNRERQAQYEAGAEQAFTLWGAAWWLFAGLREIQMFLPQQMLGASLGFAAVAAALLVLLADRARWPVPGMMAAYLPALAAMAGLLHAAAAHPFAQWGAPGWLLVFAAHYLALRSSEAQEIPGRAWLHAGACWTLALLIAWEASWRIGERTTGVWASLPWGLAPALLAAWLGRSVLRPRWPLAQHARAYRLLGAAPLLAASALWIALVNLTNRGDPAWLPYLPLLNPLDVSVALCFAAGALWGTSLPEGERAALRRIDPRALLALLAALAFLWLNAALIRSLHHNWGAPFTAYGLARSTLVQSALSIFWGVIGFAAMTVAARRSWRLVWLAGAGLMTVVIVKLFLLDLSNVGAIARITSFLSVGALLLLTGYLAPLPPRRGLQQAQS